MSSSSTLPNRNTIITTPLEQSLWNVAVDTGSDIVYSNPQNSIRFMVVGDDFSNSITTVGTIITNSTSTGHIDSATDTDWFKINLNKDDQVQIDLQSTSDINALRDTLLEGIYDSQGNLIANTRDDDGGKGTNSRLLFAALASGDYFISASAYGNQSGNYTLTTTSITDDFDQTTNTRGFIALDGNYQHAIIESAGDIDWFKISLQTDQKIQINIASDSTATNPLSDVLLQGIYTAQGQLIANTQDDDSGLNSNARLDFTAANTTDYFIAVSSAFTGDTGSYKLKVNNSIGDDFSNSLNGYGGLSTDSPTTGTINFSGDTDWHKIALNAGDKIVINLEGLATNKGDLTDPFLQGIYNSQGLLINSTSNDNGGTGTNARLTFTAPSTNNYYIAAGAAADEIGRYQLTANLITDDFENTIQTTGLLTLNQTNHGEIETEGDTDWFKLSLQAGQQIVIHLEALSTQQGTLNDPIIQGVFNSSGTKISGTTNDDSGIGTNSRLTFTVETTGDYFIAASAHNTDTGTYTIKAQYVADDYTHDNKTQGLALLNASVTGILENVQDQDWFKIHLNANQTIKIDLEGSATNQGSLNDPSLLGIYDYNSNLLANTGDDNGGIGNNSRLIFTANTKDDYFIATGSQTAALGSYTLSIQEITDDYSNDIKTQGTLAFDTSITGILEDTGDQDWFKIHLDANQTIQIDLEGSETSKGTLIDPLLSGIYNNAGILINNTLNDDGGTGTNSRLIFTTVTASDYFIAAQAYGNDIGSYQLKTTLLTDDFSSLPNTTGVFSNNIATGNIEYAGDTDWFKLSLNAGEQILINLDSSSVDTFLRGIYYSNDNTLINGTTDDDSGDGTNSQLIFRANTAGDYFIAAGAYSDDVGSYQLKTELITNDDFSNSINTTAIFSGNSATKTGEINYAGDTDWFKFQLIAGEQLVIDLTSATIDTVIHGIYNSNGTFINGTRNDDSGDNTNARLLFTADTTGDYFIAAGSYGAEVGAYTVTINSQTDDYTDNINTQGLLGLNTPTTGILETNSDHDWFKLTLTEHTDQLQVSLDNTNNLSTLANIYDSSNQPINYTYNTNTAQAIFNPVANEYFIDITGNQSNPPYSLTVTELDYSDTINTSGIINSNTTITGSISSATDIDWFKIELQENDQILIDLEGIDTNQGSLSDPLLLGIYHSNGTLIDDLTTNNIDTQNDDGGIGTNSRLAFKAASNGSYFIAASAYNGAIGSYTLKTQELPDDYTDNNKTQGFINLDSSTTGTIEINNDQDWFKLSLKAGEQVQIDLEGAETNKGSLRDPIIAGIYDNNSLLIANTLDDDGGSGANARLNFTASADGDYFISAGSYGNEIGDYQLTATLTSIDFINDINVESILNPTDSKRGELKNTGDKNWFKIHLNANQTIQLDLKGIDSSITTTNTTTAVDRTNVNTIYSDTTVVDITKELTLPDPLLAGIYYNGLLLANTINDDGGNKKDARLIFTAQEAGDYFIAASATGDGIGSYALESQLITEGGVTSDDYAANINTQAHIVFGQEITANIETSGDIDWFKISLTASQRISIDLEGITTAKGTLSDPSLQGIYNSQGVFIIDTSNNDGGTGTNAQLLFTANTAGDYFIAATGYDNQIGTYTINIQELADDYTSDLQTDGFLNLNQTLNGEIEDTGDIDWFKLSLIADQAILIDLEGIPTEKGTLRDTLLQGIYDSAGALIANTTDDDGGIDTNSQLIFNPTTTGDYFIAATAYGPETGSYSLKYQNFSDDYTDNIQTKGTLVFGTSVTGRIDKQMTGIDQDWFKLSLKAGERVQIDLEGTATGKGSLRDPSITGVYDYQGNIIANNLDDDGGEGANARLNFTASADNNYFISASSFSDETGSYQLTATLTNIDFINDIEVESILESNDSRRGEIKNPGEKNWFKLSLDAGQTIQLDLKGIDSNINPLNFAVDETKELTLPDPLLAGIYYNGLLLANTINDDGGNKKDARLIFTAQEAGDYFIAASATGESIGSYQLDIQPIRDDFLGTLDTLGALTLGSTITGAIELVDDTDWFKISLKTNDEILIDLEGASTEKGSLSDPLLVGIYNSNGAPIDNTTNNDNGTGLNSQLTFTATADNDYFIAASSNNNGIGNYQLKTTLINSDITDDFTQDITTQGTLILDTAANGTIEKTGDQDWFKLVLKAGEQVRLDLEGTATLKGTLADPLLASIYDSNGLLIANTDDDDGGEGSNSRINFTALETGNYYISASAYNNEIGSYQLTATRISSDFINTIEVQDTLTIGHQVSSEIKISRDIQWFKLNLEANKSIKIDLQGNTLSDPLIAGIYYNGLLLPNTINDDDGIGKDSQLIFNPQENGDYFIAASAYEGAIGSYTINTQLTGDQFSNDINSQGTLVGNKRGIITSDINFSGDTDWFKIHLTAGQNIQINLEGLETNKGTLTDPYLRGIYNANGTLITKTEDDDSGTGTNAQVNFTALSTGDYFISAGAYATEIGTYQLSTKLHYELITNEKTFTNAQADAVSKNGQLVKIDSVAENEFIAQLLADANITTAWLGATDTAVEGTWQWLDNTAINTSLTSQSAGLTTPAILNADDYATIDITGQWNDSSGQTQLAYIIEYPLI